MSRLERGFGVAGGLTRFGGGNGVRVGLGVTIFQPPASGRSSRLGFQRERGKILYRAGAGARGVHTIGWG
jgi:hypothetical protein